MRRWRCSSADLALVRADLDERGIGGRIADRVGESTMDMVDEAADSPRRTSGKVAAGHRRGRPVVRARPDPRRCSARLDWEPTER